MFSRTIPSFLREEKLVTYLGMDDRAEKLIMLDFDSTIADSLHFFSRVIEEKVGIRPAFGDIHDAPSGVIAEKLGVPAEVIEEAARVAFRSMDFVHNVLPLPGAIESISELEKLGYSFKIVSARENEEIAAPARVWLQSHDLGHIPFFYVPLGASKGPYVEDCVLGVDDVPNNLEMMKTVVPHLVLIDHYGIGYKTDFYTAHSWDDINGLIRKLV